MSAATTDTPATAGDKELDEKRLSSTISSKPSSVVPLDEPTYVSNCCSREAVISKGLVRFLVTSFFTLILLGFAMFKLASANTTGDEKALYYSLLSSCLAVYLPAPTPHDPPAAASSSNV